jgi:hypothetical protein
MDNSTKENTEPKYSELADVIKVLENLIIVF